jgi:hypothetical protein
MKTTSRKRLLISSVAMLLVAMLALGTATFAWFTTDTTTQATGISVQTSKKSLLLVSSRTSEWTDNLNYNFGTDTAKKLLQPASSYDGANWYKAQAVNGLSGAATTGEKITGVGTTDAEGNVFCNMLTHGFIRFLHNLVQNASVQKIGILCHFEEQIFLVKLVQAV